MRGTSFSKRRNQWRAAGIEIDFGRLPLLKRRRPGHTLRTDKSCRSDQDKDKSLEAARGHDVGPVGHEQEVPSDRGPRNSWRVYQQPSRKRERERKGEGNRRFASFACADAETSRRVAPISALESCRPPQTRAEDADTLRPTPDGLVSFSIVSFACDSALRPTVLSLSWTTQ